MSRPGVHRELSAKEEVLSGQPTYVLEQSGNERRRRSDTEEKHEIDQE